MKTHKIFQWPTLGTIQFLVLFAVHLFSTGLSAQTTTSTIEGTIRDPNGAVVAGAQVKVVSTTLGTERVVVTDSDGNYRIVSLPAGTYTITVTHTGFAPNTSNVELTLNRVAKFDVQLLVGGLAGNVEIADVLPLIEPNASSTGATVTPKQIQDMPVNGREYLDLLQLVPGVAINRQSSGDNANPVLGERSGNNNFFIDGQPNKNTVTGGPAAAFNQETIAEFQVLTAGYKAEFGQASGAQVNVITRSGGNQFHGIGSFFVRNDALDSSNSLDAAVTKAPELSRYDYSFAFGGPIWRDKMFFFGSAERIEEDRGIDFAYPALPPALDDLLHAQEDPFDGPRRYRETRMFLKLNENFGRHQLTQQVNYTNENTKGSGTGLPSTRSNSGARYLLLGFADAMTLGDQANPWIVTLRGGYRGEPSDTSPTNPEILGLTRLNSFSAPATCATPMVFVNCALFGDLPAFNFGNPSTPAFLDQKYSSFSASANKIYGDHDIKFGWQYLKTKVDGALASIVQNQVFATVDDYINFGPRDSGIYLLGEGGGATPEDNELHLNNHYNGLYVQDDWRIRNNLTVNLGIRWDHDSEFSDNSNFSPRLGVAWAINPKTIIRAQFGKFFDQFRLGLVSQVPAFGGANQKFLQYLYFPRGLYGSPSIVSSAAFRFGLPGPCFSNQLTDAQITAAGGVTCQLAPGFPVVSMIGVDRLNRVVAAGHALIPANAVINISNIQQLSGLTPEQYLTQAAAAIGQANGYFAWGRGGVLTNRIIPEAPRPVAVDSTFETPHTVGFSVGFQRELTPDMMIEVDYHHRKMNNLLGTRLSNLTFQSRVFGRSFDPPGSPELPTFGPFYEGKYDALVISFNKRLSSRYQLGASYTWSSATDNNMGINSFPSDNYIGTVPLVTQGANSNVNGSFTATNGRFVPQAGTFHNGPDLDKGPSDLALDHIFQANGLVDLPWQFQISGIFRVQSGFHFTRFDEASIDWDGNGNFTGLDVVAGRNAFTAPAFVNLDLRFSKRFDIGERVKLHVLFEYFNVFNRQNPAIVQNRADSPLRPTLRPFGTADQVLPGREGQFGFRIEF